MKWISSVNRQSILPILFGISLTTFGVSVAILLYSMLERDDDKDKDKKKHATSNRKEISIQLRIPEKYVSAVIGKAGIVIKNVQELTNTYIKMEKKNLYSSERVCCIRGYDMESIRAAQNLIQGIIENQPVVETFELFVPFEASKRVFTRNYNGFAQKVQKSSGAKVIVENSPHKTATGLKRRIILKGTADQIAPAVIQIEDKVQEELETQIQLKLHATFARVFRHERHADIEKIVINSDEIYDYLLPYQIYKEIEKDGYTVQEIEKLSGAKIIINDETIAEEEDKERKVTIKGTAKQINLAKSLIESQGEEVHESRIETNDVTIKKISELSLCNNDSNMFNNVSNPALQEDGLMEVYVSAMQTPNLFWIQVIGSTNDDLQRLVFQMTEYYNNKEMSQFHILKEITEGQMVAAKFKYDNMWYRAEVISVINSTTYKVFFVDYGDVDIVDKEDTFELCTSMLSLRQQAVECSLANVKPQGDTWNAETINKFTELVYLAKCKPLIAKVRGYKERLVSDGKHHQSSLIPCIDLYDRVDDKNVNIADKLIQLEMAQIDEDVCSAINSALSPSSHDKCNFPFVPFLSDSFHID